MSDYDHIGKAAAGFIGLAGTLAGCVIWLLAIVALLVGLVIYLLAR